MTQAETELARIWQLAGLESGVLPAASLPDASPTFASSFRCGLIAQTSIGAAAAAAAAIYEARTAKAQSISVERRAAELECTGYFKLNGEKLNAWEKFSGLYPTADGYLRIHANFEHHRDGVLRLLGLGAAESLDKASLAAALSRVSAAEFETQAMARGLVVAKVRDFKEWDAHPHAQWSVKQPLIKLTKIADAPARRLDNMNADERPLSGVRVLDLTRILAGPVAGRTLAAYGADVMLVNSPTLPNISSIVDTSRGKRSALVDLSTANGVRKLQSLAGRAQVFIQGYRPGGLAKLGFSPSELAALNPGIVYVSLSAYGSGGHWSERRGFDSLVQSVAGFNHAEAQSSRADLPQSLPMPILDYASGFLMAFGTQAAMLRQMSEGGSWHVEVSLLKTADWLRELGQYDSQNEPEKVNFNNELQPFLCDQGELLAIPHAAQFSTTPARWERASVVPGADVADW
ncbi:MAG: crotonobetainyl-CoA:carnitine CoA-transferase CaiB-like acyl-CoA transferase [Limisphaerales bacterium]